jgi:hypothetical protein
MSEGGLLCVSSTHLFCKAMLTSRPFAIIVFSTLFLMIMAGGSVMLLMTIGDTKLPSTLNLAIGTNMKRD